MLVSVVIPVYNRKDFIRQCLDSVLSQGLKEDYEVIVVDDGSTDGTIEILKEFSSRVKLHFSIVNQGVSCARNQGVQLAKGKFVAMIDSDCMACPDWLSELIEPFDQDEDIMIVGGRVEDITANSYWQTVNKGFNTFIANSNGYADRVIGCNMAIRREFVLAHPYDECLKFAAGDDTDLCWSCHELGFNVFYTNSARVTHHHRSTLKGNLIQQFLYGYVNTYLCIKFDRFPYVPYGLRILLLLLLCLLLGLGGFAGAWAAAVVCWIMFSYICWYHGTKAWVKTKSEVFLTYPGNYLLYTVFCVGCLSYFLLPDRFLRKPVTEGNGNRIVFFIKVLWFKCTTPGIQLRVNEVLDICRAIYKHPRCRLLIFGAGHDTPFWLKVNKAGETVFLEDDPKWFDLVTKKCPSAPIYLVNYHTQLPQWQEFLNDPDQLEMHLPDNIVKPSWDVILVDGPCGQDDYFMRVYGRHPPGRMQSIYMASKLGADGTDVFVHDCNRQAEAVYTETYLKNCIAQSKGPSMLRQYRVDKTNLKGQLEKKIEVALLSPFLPIPPVKGGGIERGIFESTPYFKNTHFQVFSNIYGIERPVIVRGINAQYVQFPLNEKLYACQNQWNYAVARKYHFPSFDFFLIRQVMRYLKQDPDIIEVRNNFFYIPLLRRRFLRSRLILKMHNEYFFQYPHQFKQYVRIIDSVDCIITNSHFLKNSIVRQYPQAEKKIQVIHNAVALHRFKKLPDDAPQLLEYRHKLNIRAPREKTFIFVGRIDPVKGVHVLVEAFKQVLVRHPDAQLIVVGSSWFADDFRTPYSIQMRRMILAFKHAVIFTGFIHHDELNYIYNLAGVSVVPSIWQEPFGLINLESMAAGCAVIASRVGGIPEIVTHEKTGLLVEPSNVRDLSDQMIFLLEHPDQRERLAVSGNSYAQKHGDWDVVAQKTESIYQDILGMDQ